MKKVLAIILLAAMALSIVSCGSKPEFVKMDPVKVTGVYFTAVPDAEIDKDTFVEKYNSATVVSKAVEDDKSATDVIPVTLTGDKVFTLYYLGDNEFAVTGTDVETSYVIDAPELYEYYNSIVDPEAEFVSVSADDISSAVFTAYPDSVADAAAIVEAYGKAEFAGKAGDEKGTDTILLFHTNETDTLILTFIGEDQFLVSGTLVEIDYIVESADLAKLYSEATK